MKIPNVKKPNWSEWEIEVLKVMKRCSIPNYVIAKALNRSKYALAVKCSKLSIKAPLSKYIDDSVERSYNIGHRSVDNKVIGTVNEDYVKVKLAMLGYDVFLPYMNNHKTDLIAMWKGKTIRIQVKSGTYETSSKRYRVSFTTKDKNNKFIRYKPKDVDFFIVKCNGIDTFYIIPFQIAAECSYGNLYPHRIKQVHKGRVDWEVFRDNFDLLKKFQPLMKQK